MRRFVGVVAGVGLALMGAPVARAGGPAPGPLGTPCSATPAAGGSAYLTGGPYAGDGTLNCSIQLGQDRSHSDPDVASASVYGSDVVVLAPTPISYVADPDAARWICTEFTVTGGPTLYWDALGVHWTTDPDARCGNLDVAISKCSPTDPDCTSAPPGNPPAPFYPRGTVEISEGPGGITYGFNGFDPPLAEWGCTIGDKSVTCTPPAPGDGFYNVCGSVSVAVTNQGVARVDGNTRCAYGKSASASAQTPGTPAAAAAAAPNAAFGWVCTAQPDTLALLLWTVRCNVAA